MSDTIINFFSSTQHKKKKLVQSNKTVDASSSDKALEIVHSNMANPFAGETDPIVIDFLNSLDEKDLKSYFIAKSFLGTSFNVYKSNCFVEYKEKK